MSKKSVAVESKKERGLDRTSSVNDLLYGYIKTRTIFGKTMPKLFITTLFGTFKNTDRILNFCKQFTTKIK